MNPLALLKLVNPRVWLAIALLAAFATFTGYVYRKGGDAPRAELAAIKQAAAAAALHRLKNVERTNDENTRRTTALNRELARLRGLAEFSAGPGPAGSRCPEGQLCYDEAEYTGAYRDLVREVRESAGEGAKVEIDLDSARDFENGN